MADKKRARPRLLPLLLLLVAAAIAVVAIARVVASDDNGPTSTQARFPDYGYLPVDYKGPTFRLSQAYPTQPPKEPLPAFFKTDFKGDWKTYLLQARSYCFAGMTDTGWRPERNRVRRWYNMPWQHYGQFGREGIHGLTKEAPIEPKQLAATQTLPGVTYAVAFYNAAGGYAIGRVWKKHGRPDPSYTTKPNPGFPNGTVVCKILFANLPTKDVAAQVPFFVNPIQWDAYVTRAFRDQDRPTPGQDFDSCLASSPSCLRAIEKVTLIQMDIMVKDERAPTSWIFGTFQYNGTLNNADPWENLAPLGLMWGNDPGNNVNSSNPTPVRTEINPEIEESIINPDTNEIPPTHLGWNGRLDGPVDDPQSSCMSCHMTAEYPQKSPILPRFEENPPAPGSDAWMRWFQNVQCTTPFDAGPLSTDNSLQLAQSIQNFYTWRDTKDGIYAPRSPLPAALRGDIDTIVRDIPDQGQVRSHMQRR
jgi:hypothetical protein